MRIKVIWDMNLSKNIFQKLKGHNSEKKKEKLWNLNIDSSLSFVATYPILRIVDQTYNTEIKARHEDEDETTAGIAHLICAWNVWILSFANSLLKRFVMSGLAHCKINLTYRTHWWVSDNVINVWYFTKIFISLVLFYRTQNTIWYPCRFCFIEWYGYKLLVLSNSY